ncbi:hypothetical protein K525DRAFT_185077 [Schizophyllum commune Loenen D]|nr:hypothetical protein K525DRAFT_185077 [Schizophyllum commune Loenen D]
MQKRIDAALTKDGVLAKLNGDMRQRIEEKVKQQVAKKVKEQMSENISDTLRKGVDDYKRQIAEVEQGLHNADARRQNSLLGSSGRKLGEMKLQPVYPEVWANKETPPAIPTDFPATLNVLWSMPLADLTRLMTTGYGISVKEVVARRKKGQPHGDGNGAEKERGRAAMIAFFMQHIGVPFSATSTTSDTQPGRIVITRVGPSIVPR